MEQRADKCSRRLGHAKLMLIAFIATRSVAAVQPCTRRRELFDIERSADEGSRDSLALAVGRFFTAHRAACGFLEPSVRAPLAELVRAASGPRHGTGGHPAEMMHAIAQGENVMGRVRV